MPERERAKCHYCGGTGRLFISRSIFIADGHKKIKCWLCGGTGYTRERGDREFAARQAKLRNELNHQPGAEARER